MRWERQAFCVILLLILLLLLTSTAWGSTDHLVIINVPNSYTYALTISAIQKIGFVPNSTLSVFSSSNREFILNKYPITSNDNDWKAELAKSKFKDSLSRELGIAECNNVYNGHFGNDDKEHTLSEIVTIFTGYNCLCGDTSFIEKIRKKKTFVVAIGSKKNNLCPVFGGIAANEDHMLDIRNGSSLDSFTEIYRVRLFKDTKNVCDTDKYKQPTYKYCSNECFRSCSTTILHFSDYCKTICPYYKKINNSVMHDTNHDCGLMKQNIGKSKIGSIKTDVSTPFPRGTFIVVTACCTCICLFICIFICFWCRDEISKRLRSAFNRLFCRRQEYLRANDSQPVQETDSNSSSTFSRQIQIQENVFGGDMNQVH